MIKILRSYGLLAFFGLLLMTLIITFEAGQQMFYLKRFELAYSGNLSYSVLIRSQLIRWLIWLVMSVPLVLYIKSKYKKGRELFITDLLKFVLFITTLTIIDLIAVSLISLMLNGGLLTSFFEYFEFFTYQKSLLFFIAYLGVAFFTFLVLNHEEINLKVEELINLKDMNESLYQELKESKTDDKAPIISIKTGNKVKLVPVDKIIWLQADDYCVRVHTEEELALTIRTSLQSLENKLKGRGFLRIHRNALINKGKVLSLNLAIKPKLVMENDISLEIANSRLSEVKNALSGIEI